MQYKDLPTTMPYPRRRPRMPEFRPNLALVIGIEQYQSDRIPNLRTAVDDAQRLSDILKKEHKYQVELLTNEEATYDAIMDRLATTYRERLSEKGRFLFYFAGHGTAIDSDDGGPRGYLLPHDAKSDQSETFLSMHAVNKALSAMACRHLMVVLDSCFAGTFRWSATRHFANRSPRAIYRERYDRFIREPAWQVITSSSHDETASDVFKDRREKIGNHSPFALALFEALEKNNESHVADHSGGKEGSDGVLTALELYQHLEQRVQHYSERINHRQTPEIWPLKKHGKGQFIFHVGDLNLKPAPRLDAASNPYRGLSAYDQEHADLFFGRGAEIESLYERVRTNRLTVVLGASGTGKSSLVKAGLLPKLQEDEELDWHVLPIVRPGTSPMKHLEVVMKGGPSVAALPRDDQGIHVLLIDQFEELYTLTRQEEDRQAVLRVLAKLLKHPQLRIILALRTDFEAQFTARKELINTPLGKAWSQGRYEVPAMSRSQLRAVIEEPALAMVVHFDTEPENLVDHLIDDVLAIPGSLPMLSFVLSEMYVLLHRRFSVGDNVDRVLTWEDYNALGGVSGSIQNRAYSVFIAFSSNAERDAMLELMLRMVTIQRGDLVRQRVFDSDLRFADYGFFARVEYVKERLTQARLCVRGTDEAGNAYIEPAQQALVQRWKRLLGWITLVNRTEANLEFRQKLTIAAREWAHTRSNKVKRGLLWVDEVRAGILGRLLEQGVLWMNKNEFAFSEASVKRREEEVYRAQLFRTAAIVLEAERNEDPLKKALLISELPDAFNMHELGSTLYPVIDMMQHRYPADIFPCESGIMSIAFSPRGNHFATGLADGSVRFWALDGEEVRPPIQTESSIKSVSFNPQGDRMVTCSHKGAARIWFLDNKLDPIDLPTKSKVLSACFSPVDEYVATGLEDGSVIVWSSDGKIKQGPFDVGDDVEKNHKVRVLHVSFNTTGTLLLTGLQSRYTRIWDWKKQKMLHQIDVMRAVRYAAFSPDSKHVVTEAGGHTARRWSLQHPSQSVEFPVGSRVVSICHSPMGNQFVTGSVDGIARIWSSNSEEDPVALYVGPEVNSMAISPRGDCIVTGAADGNARLWSLEEPDVPFVVNSKSRHVHEAVLSPDDKHILAGLSIGRAEIWPLNGSKKPVWTGKANSEVMCVAFSPEGDRVAAGSRDGKVRVWVLNYKGDRFESKLFFESTLPDLKIIHSISFIPGRKGIVAATQSGTVVLWPLEGKNRPRMFQRGKNIRAVACSPTGDRIASGSDDMRVCVWHIDGEENLIETRMGDKVKSVVFDREGNWIAAGSVNGNVALWSLHGKNKLSAPDRELDLRNDLTEVGKGVKVTCVTFNPSGDRVAIGASDGYVRIWALNGQGWRR